MYGSFRFTSPRRSVILLAPPRSRPESSFRYVSRNSQLHERLLGEMQRLRGNIQLQMGVIGRPDLSADGRQILPVDAHSWHLLILDSDGSVAGCARYLQHSSSVRFEDLSVRHSALAESAQWGPVFRSAAERELAAARQLNFSYVEIGGWAMADHVRRTAECLRSVLMTYAWSRLIGGALGVSTAVEMNGSAAILKRLGGQLLTWRGETLPPYFDPRHGCRLQMLRFDSRTSMPRYEKTVRELMKSLAAAPVICSEAADVQPSRAAFGKLRMTWPALVPAAAGMPASH